MPDNQEILEVRADFSNANKGADEFNKKLKDGETQTEKNTAALGEMGDAAEKAQLKVVSFIDTTARAMGRIRTTAQTRAEFAGMGEDMARLTRQARELRSVQGDPKILADVIEAHNKESAAIAKTRAEEKALAKERAEAAVQQKRLDAEAVAAQQRQRVVTTAQRRAEETGLTPEQRRQLDQRREIQATSGDTARMLQVAEAQRVENTAIKENLDLLEKLKKEKEAQLRLDQEANEQRRRAAENMAAETAAAQQRQRTVQAAQRRAEEVGLTPEQRLALDQRREIEASRGDTAAMLQLDAAHRQYNTRLAETNRLAEENRQKKKAEKDLEDKLAEAAAKRNALERQAGSFISSSLTPLQKLEQEYQKLSTAFKDDPKMLAELGTAFDALKNKIENVGKAGQGGLFSRASPLGRGLLGLKDLFEGRTAYGEVELGTAAQMAFAGGGVAAGLAIPAGVIAGYGALAAASAKAAEALGQFAVQFRDIQERTGLATPEVNKFKFAAEAVGQDVGITEHLMRGLTQAVDDMSPAGDKARKVLADMGVAARDAHGQIRPTAELLKDIGAGFARLQPGTQSQRDAMELFKRFGQEAIPFLRELNENLKTADELGIPGPTDDQLNQWKTYNLQIKAWGLELEHIKLIFEGKLGEIFGGFFGVGVIPTELKGKIEELAKAGKLTEDQIKKFRGAGLLDEYTQQAQETYTKTSGLVVSIASLGAQRVKTVLDQTGDQLEVAQRKLTSLKQDYDEARTLAEQQAQAKNLTQADADAAIKNINEKRKAYEHEQAVVKSLQEFETKRTEAAKALTDALAETATFERDRTRAEEQNSSKIQAIITDTIKRRDEIRALGLAASTTAKALQDLERAADLRIRIAGIEEARKQLSDVAKEDESRRMGVQGQAGADYLKELRFQEETYKLKIKTIDDTFAYDEKKQQEARDDAIRQLELTDPQTIGQKVAFEQKKAEIEQRFIDISEQNKEDAIQRELEGQIELAQKTYTTQQDLDERIQILNDNALTERVKAQEEAANASAKAWEDANIKAQHEIIEADKKVFETFKSESESVIDTLFHGGKGFGQALGNAMKDAVEKPLKDILSSQIAARLTTLVTGDTVTMQQQYQGRGAIGRFLTRAGFGAIPTFGNINLQGHLGDLKLITKGGVPSAPVYVTNSGDMQPKVSVQSPPSNVTVNNTSDAPFNYFNLPSRAGGPPVEYGAGGGGGQYGAPPQITLPQITPSVYTPTGGAGDGAAAGPAYAPDIEHGGITGQGGTQMLPTTGGISPQGLSEIGRLLAGPGQQQPPLTGGLIKALIQAGRKVTVTTSTGGTRTYSAADLPGIKAQYDKWGFRLRDDQIAAQLSSPYLPESQTVPPDLTMPDNVFGGAGYGMPDYSGLGPPPIPQLGYDPGMSGAAAADTSNVFGLQSIADTGAPYISPSELPVAAGEWGGPGGTLTAGGGIHSLMGLVGGHAISASAIASFAAPWAITGGLMAMSFGRQVTSNPQAGVGRGIAAGALGAAGGLAVAGGLAALAPATFVPLLAALGPIGIIAIPAAIGAMIALSGFLNSRLRQIRDQVKSVYGVDIKDNGVLQQLSKMVDQHGGNIRMTILTQEARSLIQLYALSSGQNARGIVSQPVTSNYAMTGGQMTQVPSYWAGQKVYPGQLQSSIGTSYMNPGVWNPSTASFLTSNPVLTGSNVIPAATAPQAINLSLDGASTNALLTGGAVQAIQDNPRLVSVATVSGQDASAGRRDQSANVLQPNFIVS